MRPPTRKQRKLEHVIERLTVDGVPPSYVELAAEMGVTHGSIRALVVGLCERGRVRRVPGKPRTLELVRPPFQRGKNTNRKRTPEHAG